MPIRETLWRARAPAFLVAVVAGSAIWLAVVGAPDPGGPYGASAAARAQAIMSVGAILAAVVINQGAGRRDRQTRLEAAAAARAARLKVLEHCAAALDNAAEAAAKRVPKRGQRFEGLALEAVLAARQTARHFADRGSDNDPILLWVLNRAVAEADAAAAALDGHRLATPGDLAPLQRIARTRAQGLREILDEYQAGLYDA